MVVKTVIKKILPGQLLRVCSGIWRVICKTCSYRQYDSSLYWRGRAQGSGQSRVLWTNEEYNQLYRRIQSAILQEFVAPLPPGSRVLDIGCGIGVVARMLTEINPGILVDAVDFPEMIHIARQENCAEQINYIESSAEAYWDANRQYQFIVSSACFSAIRDIDRMEKAMDNCANMLAVGGVLLMMDPFHRWNYLARVKYGSGQVIAFMRRRGLQLIRKSGVLFWPYREWLANSDYRGIELARRFEQGEKLLSRLGRHAWADYKILAFKKQDVHSGRVPVRILAFL